MQQQPRDKHSVCCTSPLPSPSLHLMRLSRARGLSVPVPQGAAAQRANAAVPVVQLQL
jgi:hypothetical protein